MKLIFDPAELPKLSNNEFWKGVAKHWLHVFDYWETARTPLEEQWMENDRAYFCLRRLPETDGMQFIDTSDFGEPDIFDGVNNLSIRLALAQMPKDESWLTVLGRSGEPPQITKAVQAQQIWMHRRAKTRKIWHRHLKQLIVRGTSYLSLRWDQETYLKRLGRSATRRKMKTFLKMTGQPAEAGAHVDRARMEDVRFNGPNIRILDTFDYYADPEQDIIADRRPANIVLQYWRPSDMKGAKNELGEDMFTLPKELVPSKAADLFQKTSGGRRKLRSLEIRGMKVSDSMKAATDLIEVFTCYARFFEHEGFEFHDTYFHIARGGDGEVFVIGVEENPSDQGHNLIVSDHFIEFWTNTGYGIGGVEKLLSAWHQKNFLSAVWLNAAAAATFPAYLLASGVLKDDLGINLTPGAINEVAMAALASEVIKPVPAPISGVQIGMQEMELYHKKINAGFEVSGAYDSGSQGGQSNRETATSVNYRATNQGVAIDEISERFGDSLQDVCQWAYDMNQQTADPENGTVNFGQVQGNRLVPGEIKFELWKQPRSIEVLGLHGVINKQQSLAEKREGLQVLSQAGQFLPNASSVINDLTKAYLSELNIETQPESWMSPQEIAAQDPQVQMMALQNALQNPQIMQMLQQGGGAPNGQQAGGPPNGPPPGPPGPQGPGTQQG